MCRCLRRRTERRVQHGCRWASWASSRSSAHGWARPRSRRRLCPWPQPQARRSKAFDTVSRRDRTGVATSSRVKVWSFELSAGRGFCIKKVENSKRALSCLPPNVRPFHSCLPVRTGPCWEPNPGPLPLQSQLGSRREGRMRSQQLTHRDAGASPRPKKDRKELREASGEQLTQATVTRPSIGHRRGRSIPRGQLQEDVSRPEDSETATVQTLCASTRYQQETQHQAQRTACDARTLIEALQLR